MRSEVNCRCGNQVGWEYFFPETRYGQDPPETEFFNEELVDSEGEGFCSDECYDKAHPPEEEEEESETDNPQIELFPHDFPKDYS